MSHVKMKAARGIKTAESSSSAGTETGTASALDGPVILPRPSVQAPLRDSLHSFISGATREKGASVVVVQGGGGCGKSILVDQLAAKVAEDTENGNIPENRAPAVCSLVAALHHQTSPYFVWRCFLHWALDDERESHHLSPRAGSGRGLPQLSTKGKGSGLTVVSTKGLSATSTKGNSLRYAAGSTHARSRKFGDAELAQSSLHNIKMRANSIRTMTPGGTEQGAEKVQGPQKLINDKKMMQGGFKRDADGDGHAVTLRDDFKIHNIILDRLKASMNTTGSTKLEGSAIKGASPAEIAVAELLFPTRLAFPKPRPKPLAAFLREPADVVVGVAFPPLPNTPPLLLPASTALLPLFAPASLCAFSSLLLPPFRVPPAVPRAFV